MTTLISINRRHDPDSGRDYWAVRFGREHFASYWHMPDALACARLLASISGVEIQSADIVPFPKAVVA